MSESSSSASVQCDTKDSSESESESEQIAITDERSMSLQNEQEATPVWSRPLTPKVSRVSHEKFIEDVISSIPENQIHECFMRREKRGPFGIYQYQLFGDGDNPIFTARKRSTIGHCRYIIYEPTSGKIIGNIVSDAKGLVYNIEGPESTRVVVKYVENFLGRNGCRSLQVLFGNEVKYISKPPIIISGNYYQDFHDLTTIQSIKNFILVDEENFTNEVCIFVKSSMKEEYTLRVTRPFSLFIGFAIALTSLHTGLFHR